MGTAPSHWCGRLLGPWLVQGVLILLCQRASAETSSPNGTLDEVAANGLVVAPPSWQCDVDDIDVGATEKGLVRLDTCEEWEKHAGDTRHVHHLQHGGACTLVVVDEVSQTETLDLAVCQYGAWHRTDTAIDLARRKREADSETLNHAVETGGVVGTITGVILGGTFGVLVAGPFGPALFGAIGWGLGSVVGAIVGAVKNALKKDPDPEYIPIPPQRPPEFVSCPPYVANEHYAPSGKESAKVTWDDPKTKNSADSIKQTTGQSSGHLFSGLPNGQQHIIIYEARNSDGLTKTCSFSFKVKVRTCRSQSSKSNRLKDCNKYNFLGSRCTYSCEKGYMIQGRNSATCGNANSPRWSGNPSCVRIPCKAPQKTVNGYQECSNVNKGGFVYDDACTVRCKAGFRPEGRITKKCEATGKWTTGAWAVCKDDEAPVLKCRGQQVFYADEGLTSKSVTWQEPTATDNVDAAPAILKTRGPDQGVIIRGGESEIVAYKAKDAAGNNSPQCEIQLTVKVITCNHPLQTFDDARLRFSCSMSTYAYGNVCNVSCSLNLPLLGSDQVQCVRNDTKRGAPVGNWIYGNDSTPHCQDIACPPIFPPANGALVFDSIQSRPVTIMNCQKGLDIPSMESKNGFDGMWLCQDSGYWYPNVTHAPDCSKTVSSRGFVLKSEFFYYDGVCGVNDTILRNYQSLVDNLVGTIQKLCPPKTNCTIGNPEVTCGPIVPVIRKKRNLADAGAHRLSEHARTTEHERHTRETASANALIFSFDIITEFDMSGMTPDETYDYVDQIQLRTLKPAIQEKMTNGDFDRPAWTVRDDSFQTQEYGNVFCAPGSIIVRKTQCNLCPTGHYERNGTCEACQVGEFGNTSGAVSCTPCPGGYTTRQEASTSVQNCTELCRPGSFSPDRMAPCAPCQPGYFQTQVGQTSCETCPSGMYTATPGSTALSDCQKFDLYVGDTNGPTVVAELDNLDSFSLEFFTKVESDTPNMVISVNDVIKVAITDVINIVTPSTEDTLGPTSTDAWVYLSISWEPRRGVFEASYKEDLVVSHSFTSNTTMLPEVIDGHLYFDVSGDAAVLIGGFRLTNATARNAGKHSKPGVPKSCHVMNDADAVNMNHFKLTSAEAIGLRVPAACFARDACNSMPCGSNGKCLHANDGFRCTCTGGWSGETCNVPPDWCIDNSCQNGATCESGTTNYTCHCRLGYTGVFCDSPPVDGGWSGWSMWNECSLTCGNGTRARTRDCDNPAPGPHGRNCSGDVMQIEKCNTKPCPECPEPKRGFASLLDCRIDPDSGSRDCRAICKAGYSRPATLPTDRYRCGPDTSYKWTPMRQVPDCIQPARPRRYEIKVNGGYGTPVRDADKDKVMNAINTNIAGADCFKSRYCTSRIRVNNAGKEGLMEKDVGSTVTVSFSIDIKETSDLSFEAFFYNKTISPGLRELADAIIYLGSTAAAINKSASSYLDVTSHGLNYTIEPESLLFEGTVACEAGEVATEGLCAKCPAGSYQVDGQCSLCGKGSYQPQVGQSTCIPCPYGHTTEAIGADSSDDCDETTTTTSQTTATTQEPTTMTALKTTTTTPETTTTPLKTTTTNPETTTTPLKTTTTTPETTTTPLKTTTTTPETTTMPFKTITLTTQEATTTPLKTTTPTTPETTTTPLKTTTPTTPETTTTPLKTTRTTPETTTTPFKITAPTTPETTTTPLKTAQTPETTTTPLKTATTTPETTTTPLKTTTTTPDTTTTPLKTTPTPETTTTPLKTATTTPETTTTPLKTTTTTPETTTTPLKTTTTTPERTTAPLKTTTLTTPETTTTPLKTKTPTTPETTTTPLKTTTPTTPETTTTPLKTTPTTPETTTTPLKTTTPTTPETTTTPLKITTPTTRETTTTPLKTTTPTTPETTTTPLKITTPTTPQTTTTPLKITTPTTPETTTTPLRTTTPTTPETTTTPLKITTPTNPETTTTPLKTTTPTTPETTTTPLKIRTPTTQETTTTTPLKTTTTTTRETTTVTLKTITTTPETHTTPLKTTTTTSETTTVTVSPLTTKIPTATELTSVRTNQSTTTVSQPPIPQQESDDVYIYIGIGLACVAVCFAAIGLGVWYCLKRRTLAQSVAASTIMPTVSPYKGDHINYMYTDGADENST